MHSRLDKVKDWDAVATECHFQVHAVARKFQVTDRQLQRYFQRHFATTPKAWMDARRIDIAIAHLMKGESVKAVANNLNFKQPSTFSNFFKRHKGTSPSNYPGEA